MPFPVAHVSSHPSVIWVQVQASVQHHLSFRNEAYILTLHADAAGAQPIPILDNLCTEARMPRLPYVSLQDLVNWLLHPSVVGVF